MPNVLPTRELLSTHANEPAAAPGALMAEDERYDTYRFDFLAFFFFGTFAPARRASDRPMAIACFLLLTFLPDLPLLSVPALPLHGSANFFRGVFGVFPLLCFLGHCNWSFDVSGASKSELSARPTVHFLWSKKRKLEELG